MMKSGDAPLSIGPTDHARLRRFTIAFVQESRMPASVISDLDTASVRGSVSAAEWERSDYPART